MTTQRPKHIKSEAFLRQQVLNQESDSWYSSHKQHFISELPVSQSRFTISRPCSQVHRKTISYSHPGGDSGKGSASQIWKQVHSTRSQFRLQRLQREGKAQEPVLINLLQKVDRIKTKHEQKQQVQQKCKNTISRKSLQRIKMLKQQGKKGHLPKMITQLLRPIEQVRKHQQQRYNLRLLRIRKF